MLEELTVLVTGVEAPLAGVVVMAGVVEVEGFTSWAEFAGRGGIASR